MGEATLIREYRERPPKEPLDSIPALWRDYIWRYVEAGKGDPVVEYTFEAPTFKECLKRACASKGPDGKMWFHQYKVPHRAKVDYYFELLRRHKEIKACESFWEMFLWFKQAADAVPGIGAVTRYDVAVRVGAWLGLEPEHLYVHAGVAQGLLVFGIKPARGAWCVDPEQLPVFFRDKQMDLVESFMCGYRSELERVVNGR